MNCGVVCASFQERGIMCLKSPGVGRKKWLINKNVYISVAYACAHKLCKVSVFFVYDKIFSKDFLETV